MECIEKAKVVVIREELYAITKDTFQAIVLGQLLFWQTKIKDIDNYIQEEELRCQSDGTLINIELNNGWIYKKASQLIEECMMNVSETTMRRILAKLEENNLIFSRKNPKHKWDKILQYRINSKELKKQLYVCGYTEISGYKFTRTQNEFTNIQIEDRKNQIDAAIPLDNNKENNNKENNNNNILSFEVSSKPKKENYDWILEYWKTLCPHLQQPRSLDSKRKLKIKSLLNEFTVDHVKKAIALMGCVSLWKNNDKDSWKPTIDWFIKNTNSCVNGLLEGKYSFKDKDEYLKIIEATDFSIDSPIIDNTPKAVDDVEENIRIGLSRGYK